MFGWTGNFDDAPVAATGPALGLDGWGGSYEGTGSVASLEDGTVIRVLQDVGTLDLYGTGAEAQDLAREYMKFVTHDYVLDFGGAFTEAVVPTEEPSAEPTPEPTLDPTLEPTTEPTETNEPTETPTQTPTVTPSEGTTAPVDPTESPTSDQTPEPTASQSPGDTETSTGTPAPTTTDQPSDPVARAGTSDDNGPLGLAATGVTATALLIFGLFLVIIGVVVLRRHRAKEHLS